MNYCYIKMVENLEHLFHTFQCLAKVFHIRNSLSMNMFSSLTLAIKVLMSLLISLCRADYAYHWLANNGGKAAVPGINQQNVNDIWIFSPENSKVKEFGEWVQPLFTTILKNCAQNVKLAELRDTILPKLMSGELNISALDI